MFHAIDRLTDETVVTLDPKWSMGEYSLLREMARDDILICPGCEEELWFRYNVGESESKRRPHFCHRAGSTCTYAAYSNSVREAQASLYLWLQRAFPGQVELDRMVDIHEWEMPAHVHVSPSEGGPCGYWIFDRGIRYRGPLLAALSEDASELLVQVILTEELRKCTESTDPDDGSGFGNLRLSAFTRSLIRVSSFDEDPRAIEWGEPGGHLTFIDFESETLHIYRGLRPMNCDGQFAWRVHRHGPLSEVQFDRESGEIVFREDIEDRIAALAAREARARAREVARREAREARAAAEARERTREAVELARRAETRNPAREGPLNRDEEKIIARGLKPISRIEQARQWAREQVGRDHPTGRSQPTGPVTVPTQPSTQHARQGALPEQPTLQNPHPRWAHLTAPLRCTSCGEMTTEWSVGQLSDGTCRCKKCLNSGR